MNKRWIVAEKKSDDIVKQLLINRGIKLEDRDSFLNPNFDDLYDPFLLKNMDKAIKRILRAINAKETIGIFSDFDADGISGAAILGTFFNHLKIKNEIYIPSRDEGYGLNEAGILDLHEKGCQLIITVDLGITGKKHVEFAKTLGIDMIITDHHLIQEEKVPNQALAIIHPKLSLKYPNKDLAGGGVAWKLVCAIIASQSQKDVHSTGTTNSLPVALATHFLQLGSQYKLSESGETLSKWLLDLAAISTVCDMVPLVGENRIIAKYGMTVLSKTKNLGLKSLVDVAAINPEKISTYTIGYLIGPRINAPGRLEHGQISYFLLTTRNTEEAEKMAKKLNLVNKTRQDELERVLTEARCKIAREKLEKNKIILLFDENWPDGVLGLVAGRITEEMTRPTIVFTRKDKEELKGSARSTKNFHILDALDKVKDLLVKYGGHSGAAGVTIKEKNFSRLNDRLIKIADKKISDEDLIPSIKIDAELDIRHQTIDEKLLEQIKKMEPFGIGNPRPVFVSKQLAISDWRLVGRDGKHLKLKLEPKKLKSYDLQPSLEAVMFNCSEVAKNLTTGDICDIVYSIEENEWLAHRSFSEGGNGRKSIQLNIIDIKKSE